MTFLPRNRLIEQSKAGEMVMKKDVAFAIVLMVTGALGLAYPPKFSAGAAPASAEPAQVLLVETGARMSALTSKSEVSVMKCSRVSRKAEAKANLLHKVSVALADMDSMISLQSM
jgi:hypothetical protein